VATVLVLGVGGILGEAWMWGYLGGAQQATGEDFRRAKQLMPHPHGGHGHVLRL
jgi:hypothetical protein